MVIKQIKFSLVLILVLGFILRFAFINTIPSLNPDEAALGYNAYSLLNTGKDEHGVSWPLHFKSFGDYKPGGYVYLDIPFIAIFGLNTMAVRLPNLIFSIFTIYFLYKLILLITSSHKLAILSAFILSINPWHIHFSRGAWESGTALFFLVLSLFWFYSYIIHHKSYYLFLFLLPLVASLYTYHSARIIAPTLFIFLFIIYRKSLLTDYKKILLSLFLAFILTIPVFYSFVNNGGTTRFSGVGLTADTGPLSRSEELLNQHPGVNLYTRTVHNRRVLYLISFAEKYFSHFNFNFLFLNGDEVPRSRSVDMGQFYLFEIVLLFFGIIYLINYKNSHLRTLIILLFLITPLASSLTFQAPSALRSLPLCLPITVLIAIGIYYLNQIFNNKFFRFVISIFYLYSITFYISSYFIHTPKRFPYAWNFGFDKVTQYINFEKLNYQDIYVTNTYDQPYILYLFYSKYSPKLIQSQIQLTKPDKYGFSTVNQIDNIFFNIPPLEELMPNSLVISDSQDIALTLIDTIDFPNGQPGFKIYQN